MPLEDLGRLVLAKRNKSGLGIRGAAKEIGISHATLARVEKGFLPDLENYEKIRRWLGIQGEQAPPTSRKSTFDGKRPPHPLPRLRWQE